MSNKNSVGVCLEQTGGKIAGVSYEMLSGARKLANELSGEVCAVLMGHQVQEQAKDAFAYGADKVYVCDNENLENYNTGAYCKVLEKLVKENEPEILLLAATTNGRDLAGRLASRLETGLAADCTALALEDGQLVATRPTYGGNIMAEVVFPEKCPAMCTIRGNALSKDDPDYAGKPVGLNFWSSRCGPCQTEMPDFHEAYLELGQDLHFLMVNVTDGSWDTEESASSFLEEEGYTFPALYDTDSSATGAYGVYALPATYFIDGEGYVAAWAGGMIDGETLRQGIGMILE